LFGSVVVENGFDRVVVSADRAGQKLSKRRRDTLTAPRDRSNLCFGHDNSVG
jgi:hypothetical protein